ncbi:ankyrin repeat domain-containing protein [Wolbachia endosymbiont (group B) of Idaea biselata]|uniref:ankyrin repeat domain-containing protein n=1 Tax=Wolbachia endosymbiont (group B) of Idaea biselata TaxID=3066179 RepID=UPI003132F9D5
MTGEYELLKKVLSTIEVKEGLNQDNIIEEIQEELKKQDQDLYLYLEWEKGEFDLNYVFGPLFSTKEFTLLMIAAENGHTNIVEILLKKGADVNKKDSYGPTALHLAAKNGHTNIVEILVEKGADVNVRDHHANTVLYLATNNGHEGIVEILLEKGANVNGKSSFGVVPLHLAAKNGNENVVNALITEGANVNEKNMNGLTALHLAASSGCESVVKVLLQAEANVNAVDKNGKTPVDYAKSKNVIKALLEAGGGSFLKASRKGKIAGGVTGLLGTSIAVALFTTGTITAQLIPIVIAVVAVTAAALVVGYATYELLKPSTKVDGAEKSSAALINGQQGVC